MQSNQSHLTQILTLFSSNPNVYGRNQLQEGYDEKGKRKSRSWLVKEPVTERVWRDHLSGTSPMGLVPIKPDNTVVWGCIDIDLYGNKLRHLDLISLFERHALPFVTLRSKSGGGHVYLFVDTPIPAKDMIWKLASFAAWLGFGDCEIFPKQSIIGNEDSDTRYGNWIMMPYDGPDTLRYALDRQEQPLSLTAFLALAESKKLSVEAFTALNPPQPEDEPLPDGPPCLNHIFTERAHMDEMRNITMCNVAVYLKRAHGAEWKDKLNEINNRFANPLPDRELNTIKQSYEKTDYKYQCSKEPLCKFCNAGICRTRKHGVAANAVLPSNRSLTKLNTSPPIWYLNLDDNRIALTTEQLFNFRLFSMHCLSSLNYIPEPCKNDEWREIVNTMTSNCTIVEIPDELQPIGIFREILESFVIEGSQDDYGDLLRGIPYRDHHFVYLRTKDLLDRLKRERFNSFQLNEITSILKSPPYNGKKKFIHVGKSGVNCWEITNLWNDIDPNLEPTQPTNNDPY